MIDLLFTLGCMNVELYRLITLHPHHLTTSHISVILPGHDTHSCFFFFFLSLICLTSGFWSDRGV